MNFYSILFRLLMIRSFTFNIESELILQQHFELRYFPENRPIINFSFEKYYESEGTNFSKFLSLISELRDSLRNHFDYSPPGWVNFQQIIDPTQNRAISFHCLLERKLSDFLYFTTTFVFHFVNVRRFFG